MHEHYRGLGEIVRTIVSLELRRSRIVRLWHDEPSPESEMREIGGALELLYHELDEREKKYRKD